jgi:hypothetical protein
LRSEIVFVPSEFKLIHFGEDGNDTCCDARQGLVYLDLRREPCPNVTLHLSGKLRTLLIYRHAHA